MKSADILAFVAKREEMDDFFRDFGKEVAAARGEPVDGNFNLDKWEDCPNGATNSDTGYWEPDGTLDINITYIRWFSGTSECHTVKFPLGYLDLMNWEEIEHKARQEREDAKRAQVRVESVNREERDRQRYLTLKAKFEPSSGEIVNKT